MVVPAEVDRSLKELEASLVYIASPRIAKATQRNPVSKKQNKKAPKTEKSNEDKQTNKHFNKGETVTKTEIWYMAVQTRQIWQPKSNRYSNINLKIW